MADDTLGLQPLRGKVHSIRTTTDSIEFHAGKDLEYIDGLQAHCDEGGLVSAKNVSDLMAMVRWNAENLIAAISASPEDAELISLVAEGLWARSRKALGMRADYLPEGRSDFISLARDKLSAPPQGRQQ